MWWLKAKTWFYYNVNVRGKRRWLSRIDSSWRSFRAQNLNVRQFGYLRCRNDHNSFLCKFNNGWNRPVYFDLWNSKCFQYLLLLYLWDCILVVQVEIFSRNSAFLWARRPNQCIMVFCGGKLEDNSYRVLSHSFGLCYCWNNIYSERYPHLLSHEISFGIGSERLSFHCKNE